MPIQLGTPIPFQSQVNADGAAGSEESAAGFREGISFSLSFFEADGTTPVVVAETPEPNAGLLLVAGGVLLTISKKLRAKYNLFQTDWEAHASSGAIEIGMGALICSRSQAE